MKKVTRYYRKMRQTFLKVATIVSLAGFILVPTISSNAQTVASKVEELKEAYTVEVNGQLMGCVSSVAEANQAYLNARTRLNEFKNGVAYVESEIKVYQKSNADKCTVEDVSTMEDKIYDVLNQSLVASDKTTAYTIRIEDFTVSVATKEDVIKVLELVKSKYDEKDTFQVNLSTGANGGLSASMTDASISYLDTDRLSAVIDGETISVGQVTEDTVIEPGLVSLDFAEKVQIMPTVIPKGEIVSVQEAYDAISKEKEEKETYTVQSGDSLWAIAKKYDMSISTLLSMNEGMSEKTVLRIGDVLIVTVPKPELSVTMGVVEHYEEAFEADVIYIDDPNMYKGETSVVTKGQSGYRAVDCVVAYKDGVKISSQIVYEEVISEPVAKVVKRGTKKAPTYIVPVAWYSRITDRYGWRSETGSFHYGLDYAAPKNTVIRAARDGKVTYAGWKGTFGYCIEISHGDGHVSRYAHLNKMAVSVGQYVSQWETIGYVGSTGFSTGYHLHFEILVNGNRVNPEKWINK